MTETNFATMPIDGFKLELPKSDTAFLKTIAKKMGRAMKSRRRNMSAYERSLDDAAHGRINEYSSGDEFF